jgi:hypothetical protein
MTGSTASVFALNESKIATGSGIITPFAETVFASALYLACEKGYAVDRDTLQRVLWPFAQTNEASHRLRQTLLKLKRSGFPVDTGSKGTLRVDRALVMRDFDRLEEWEPTRLLDIRSVFPGVNTRFSPMFAEWIDETRSSIATLIAKRLLSETIELRRRGDWIGVERCAKAILLHSPANEEATLALAESIAMRGDKLAAVQLLDDFTMHMGSSKAELRLQPSMLRRRITDILPRNLPEPRKETALLGRSSDLALLANYLNDVRNHDCRVALITGGPGIGKSRLLSEFLAFATLQGASAHKLTCRASDSTRPLAILLELIPLLLRMRGAIGSSPETLAFFDAVSKHRPQRISTDNRVQNFLPGAMDSALIDIIEAVTEDNILVLGIEDCHWMDTTSADVLSRLADTLVDQRIFLLFTSRVNHATVPFSQNEKIRKIELAPLSSEDSVTLVHEITRTHETQPSNEHSKWCADVAEGNPFFVHELANQWMETGEEHRPPKLLQAVLHQRIARLSADALSILQACALLENHASHVNLEELLDYPAHQLLHGINELAVAGMIAMTDNGFHGDRGRRLNSKHDLLSDAALKVLSSPARSYLHRRAAIVLQRRIDEYGDVSTLWSCAKHWQLSGDVSQALRLALSCANHLLEIGLPQDAAEVFGKATIFCGSDQERLMVLELQSKAYFRSSNWLKLTKVGKTVRALRQRVDPEASEHDELELMQLRADWLTLRWDEILSRSLVCLHAEGASVDHRLAAGVMALMMLSFGDYKNDARTVMDIIERLESSETTLTRHLQARMIYHTNWGTLAEATKCGRDLVAAEKAGGDIAAYFSSLINAAIPLRAACRFDESRAMLLEAVEIAERHRLNLSKSRALPLLAHLAFERVDRDEAHHWLQELEGIDMEKEDAIAAVDLVTVRARVALLDGRFDEARSLESELSQMRNDDNAHRRVYALAVRAAVELACDGVASSETIANLQTAHLKSRSNVFQGFAACTLFVGLRSLRRADEAETIFGEYLRLHRREPCPPSDKLIAFVESLVSGKSDPTAARLTS